MRELVVHLARRELSSRHRFTLLGWAWPLARQLAQLGVLVVLFGSILDLGIDNYAVFVFAGLVAWTWFSAGLSDGTDSIVGQRHLLFRQGCPAAVLPVVAVTVAFADVLIALPVLLGMVLVSGDLHAAALFLPVLAAVQFVLLCGLSWLFSAATVYLRDVRQVVVLGLTLLFYLTPVFYDRSQVPGNYAWLFDLNPMSTLIDGYRAVLLEQSLPDAGPLALVALAAVVAAAAGLMVFQRLRGGFVDEL